LSLSPAQIDVWLTFDAEIRDAARVREYSGLLAPDEIERARRFRDEPRRQQFVVTRALTRTVLTHYLPEVRATDWRFVTGPHGKPELAPPFDAHRMYFNAAHTSGLVAMAVARVPTLGVDVENLVTGNPPLRIATRYFDADEARDLEALPAGEKRRRFYTLWTLKESWLKATGGGLGAGLDKVSFTLDRAHRARAVSFAQQTGPWHFWQAQVSAEHLLALAVEAPELPPWEVNLYRCVPGTPPTRVPLPAPLPLHAGG
jgi:4'-phosphopantetheinyl transferase